MPSALTAMYTIINRTATGWSDNLGQLEASDNQFSTIDEANAALLVLINDGVCDTDSRIVELDSIAELEG